MIPVRTAGLTVAALFTSSVALAVAAFVFVNGERAGNLPWFLSPRGLLTLAAVIMASIALGVLWRLQGQRLDERVRVAANATVVTGCLTDARVKGEVGEIVGYKLAYLPTRVTLVGTAEGLEVWGGPQATRYLSVVWDSVLAIDTRIVPSLNRTFRAIAIELDTGKLLALALAGSSVTGFSSPSAVDAHAVVDKFMALSPRASRARSEGE